MCVAFCCYVGTHVRDRPFNLMGGGGGGGGVMVRVRIFNFFPEFNIRLYDKNSESDYFFSLHQNQNIFFSNIGNQNICLEKNHNPPPFKLNGRSLTKARSNNTLTYTYLFYIHLPPTQKAFKNQINMKYMQSVFPLLPFHIMKMSRSI